MELGQRPPDRLDVLVGEGEVGVVQVGPVAEALGHGAPLALVGAHALEAGPVELGDAVLFDLLLAGEAEALLDLDLHRQPVGVPAGLAGHVVALHGAEAGEEVLGHPRRDVADVGHVVGGRRAFVEDELAPGGGLGHGLLEDLAFGPASRGSSSRGWGRGSRWGRRGSVVGSWSRSESVIGAGVSAAAGWDELPRGERIVPGGQALQSRGLGWRGVCRSVREGGSRRGRRANWGVCRERPGGRGSTGTPRELDGWELNARLVGVRVGPGSDAQEPSRTRPPAPRDAPPSRTLPPAQRSSPPPRTTRYEEKTTPTTREAEEKMGGGVPSSP